MLTDPVTLVGDSASTRDYALVSIEKGKSLRSVSTPVAPITSETLTISSTKSVKGGITTVRHLIRLDRTLPNGTGVPVNAGLYTVIEVPVDAVITQAMIKDMRTQMASILGNTTLVKILNGEP